MLRSLLLGLLWLLSLLLSWCILSSMQNLPVALPFLVDKLECMIYFSTCDFLIRSTFFPVLSQVVCSGIQIRVGVGDLTN